jgi:hypothetical protein
MVWWYVFYCWVYLFASVIAETVTSHRTDQTLTRYKSDLNGSLSFEYMSKLTKQIEIKLKERKTPN